MPEAVQPVSDPDSKLPFDGKPEAGAVTVTETVVVCVALEPVPVTVTVKVPVAAPESTATVIVDEAPAVTEPGLKETLPVGWPLALRATDWAEPPVTAVEIVALPLVPRGIDSVVGLAPIEKSSVVVEVTVSVTVVVCVAPVPVAVTLIG